MKKHLLAGLSVLLVSACSSTSSQSGSGSELASNNDDGVKCQYVKTIGSHMKREVCTTRKQRDTMREASRDGWQRIQGGSEVQGN